MTNPRRPYRSVDHRIPLQRGPGQPLGFVRTIESKIAQLKRAVAGLEDRLRYRYGDDSGYPHAYKAEVLFEPRLDTEVDVGDVGAPVLANFVVPDAQTLSLPIVVEGPGVFMARYFTVTFYQFVNGSTEQRFALPVGKLRSGTGLGIRSRKWSFPQADAQGDDAGVCYFWNLIDRDSDRRLSDEPVSHMALLPGSIDAGVDGNLFEFPVPWLFERAGMLEFEFRLTTPILQPSGNNQPVLVRAEMHGTKFITERDAILREAV